MKVNLETTNTVMARVEDDFLMNTLNNLYSMSLLDDGRLTDSLVKLSDYFRYQYRSAELDKIPIKEEVQFLRSYFYLQRLRFNNHLDINFIHAIDRNHYISPGVFFPLLSLAFNMLQRRVVDKLGFSAKLQSSADRIELVMDIVKPDDFRSSVFSAQLDGALEKLRQAYKGQFKISIDERTNQFLVVISILPWLE
ncbi:histidine kinase [Persicobacter psychrovividus]|uniref:Signal transduction histidine kinase internal region domain-containing protein n=1 Tax=Persicobacter psychrovividus TaxID=387638 RepID=A0ABM7VC61_9BACT|nr:hypothetical protein PEPS_07480 [Persicobacter psychrovividus]